MHAAEVPLLMVGQIGLLAAQFPLDAGNFHAIGDPQADEVGFELVVGGMGIEEFLLQRIDRGVERLSEGQFHASFPKLIGDGAGIREGPGQPVGFRYDRRVALAHGGKDLIEAGPGTARAGEAVIGVDTILGDPQLQERLTLGCRISPVGCKARVTSGHQHNAMPVSRNGAR